MMIMITMKCLFKLHYNVIGKPGDIHVCFWEWNFKQILITHSWEVNIASGDGISLNGAKWLPKPMLTFLCIAIMWIPNDPPTDDM